MAEQGSLSKWVNKLKVEVKKLACSFRTVMKTQKARPTAIVASRSSSHLWSKGVLGLGYLTVSFLCLLYRTRPGTPGTQMHSMTHIRRLYNPIHQRWLTHCFAFVASSLSTKLLKGPNHSHPRDLCRNRPTENATDALTSPKANALFNPKTVTCLIKRNPTPRHYARLALE